MSELSFNQRLWLTMLLVVAILAVSSYFTPPPPEPAEGQSSSGFDTSDDEPSVDVKAPANLAPRDAVPNAGDSDTDTTPVEFVEHRISTDKLAIEVENGAAGLVRGVEPLLRQFQEKDGRGVHFLELGDAFRSLELGFDEAGTDFVLPLRNREVLEQSASRWQVSAKASGVEIIQTLEAVSGYASRFTVEILNQSSTRQRHRLRVTLRQGEASAGSYNPHRALCHRGVEEGVETFDLSDTEDGPTGVDGAEWIGLDTKYFLQALVPADVRGACVVTGIGEEALENTFVGPSAALEPSERRRYVFGVYLGAKEQGELDSFSVVDNAHLDEAVDWGWFGSLSRTLGQWMLELLRFFYRLTGIWGVAILLLTVVVKLVTLPLTLKQMNSMKRMRDVAPELEVLKKKYASDRAKLQQEMQALFSRKGVNPLAGCFPVLVQMPVWIALYAMLGTVVELYHEPFLWLPDLTAPDPMYILPVAMGALMYVQMRIQPTQPTQDPAQAKMMQWMMPAFFTFMILFVPSGLGVYIFANVLLSLIQSMIQLRPGKLPPSEATSK